MYGSVQFYLHEQLAQISLAGLEKEERLLGGPQGARIKLADGRKVLNFCANNYLGLAGEARIIAAAKEAMDDYGFGMASVRFICGTQELHKQLELKLAEFLGTEDAILYSSCFDANGGLFETILGPEDAVISDELNHASIIDGIRLCKAQRYLYKTGDLEDLEERLREARGTRFRLIATDGVFSMDGTIAKLDGICDLAEQYDALVMVDDSHATGFLGKTGRGTHEYRGVMARVDIITGTFGKALGGASGGFTAGRREIIGYLRQRSRPYLFSNSLAPPMAAAALKALSIVSTSTKLRDKLAGNTQRFRRGMAERGFEIPPGDHPIVPIMLGDAALANRMSAMMLAQGIYVVGFSYPVVPKGKARIRVQLSAAHTARDLDRAMDAFERVRTECNV